jgi:hypothetical protein
MAKPVPTPVHWDREFWNLAAQGVLSAQRCLDCGHLQHYPRPACGKCLSSNRTWQHLSGRGTVYSFTVVRRPFTPGFDDETPFVLLDVLLDEDLRLLSRLADEGQANGLGIGDHLEVVFHKTDNDLYLPYFTKVG